MRRLRLGIVVAAARLVARPAQAGDLAAAETKTETCFACHGHNGVSENEGVPSLAGQPDLFVQWQLVFFRSGRIKSEIMGPIAAELSDEDIRAIGPAFAALPPLQPAPGVDQHPDLTALGAALVRERHCGSCHGEALAGQQAAARLSGQREEMLAKALHDYKTGTRFGTGIASMPEIAYQLSDDEINALAHYLVCDDCRPTVMSSHASPMSPSVLAPASGSSPRATFRRPLGCVISRKWGPAAQARWPTPRVRCCAKFLACRDKQLRRYNGTRDGGDGMVFPILRGISSRSADESDCRSVDFRVMDRTCR